MWVLFDWITTVMIRCCCWLVWLNCIIRREAEIIDCMYTLLWLDKYASLDDVDEHWHRWNKGNSTYVANIHHLVSAKAYTHILEHQQKSIIWMKAIDDVNFQNGWSSYCSEYVKTSTSYRNWRIHFIWRNCNEEIQFSIC